MKYLVRCGQRVNPRKILHVTMTKLPHITINACAHYLVKKTEETALWLWFTEGSL